MSQWTAEHFRNRASFDRRRTAAGPEAMEALRRMVTWAEREDRRRAAAGEQPTGGVVPVRALMQLEIQPALLDLLLANAFLRVAPMGAFAIEEWD